MTEENKTDENSTEAAGQNERVVICECESINNLDINSKQSIVDLMFDVQAGVVSCRRAASEIMDAVNNSKYCIVARNIGGDT